MEADILSSLTNNTDFPYPNSSLWKRVIVWGRSRAASACGIIWGDAGENKQGRIFSAECRGVDCSGDSKVLIELQVKRIEKNSNDACGCSFVRYCK